MDAERRAEIEAMLEDWENKASLWMHPHEPNGVIRELLAEIDRLEKIIQHGRRVIRCFQCWDEQHYDAVYEATGIEAHEDYADILIAIDDYQDYDDPDDRTGQPSVAIGLPPKWMVDLFFNPKNNIPFTDETIRVQLVDTEGDSVLERYPNNRHQPDRDQE